MPHALFLFLKSITITKSIANFRTPNPNGQGHYLLCTFIAVHHLLLQIPNLELQFFTIFNHKSNLFCLFVYIFEISSVNFAI